MNNHSGMDGHSSFHNYGTSAPMFINFQFLLMMYATKGNSNFGNQRSNPESGEKPLSTEESNHSNPFRKSSPLETKSTFTAEITKAGDCNIFYKFVILHAETDELEAIRVKNMLQDEFNIKPGIIFAEMPAGQQILKNLDDAVNGSAWTILLLTENFLREAWCEFHSHATLINSIYMHHKYNSVIPMRPKDNYLPREKTPFALKLINALEEGNSEFSKQVAKTFRDNLYKKQYNIWKAEKEGMDHQSQ
ncbi:TIR domain-containing adapter molecule 2 isoform X2 [Bufo gargarizans]|uniref:TIR domain-containing adapter molecule 2 isoform X2 n=1 Tax=Bufo gargarizans TaxID=30331 RepID=UPI001CF3548C|nr:TIR domain-containing adapter molecule 2 isoform X2 [Bufo gargarizans]